MELEVVHEPTHLACIAVYGRSQVAQQPPTHTAYSFIIYIYIFKIHTKNILFPFLIFFSSFPLHCWKIPTCDAQGSVTRLQWGLQQTRGHHQHVKLTTCRNWLLVRKRRTLDVLQPKTLHFNVPARVLGGGENQAVWCENAMNHLNMIEGYVSLDACAQPT